MSPENVQLTNLDIKILKHVSNNGLLYPKSKIAKDLRISDSTLNYRLNYLEKNRIILDCIYRFNFKKIGLSTMSWLFLNINQQETHYKKLMEKIFQTKNVVLALSVTGQYDIALKLYTERMSDIPKIVSDLKKKFKKEIINTHSFICSQTFKFHQLPFKECEKNIPDRKDFKILKYASQNTKASINEISKKIGIHRNTVSKRWNNLVENKIIWKKTPIINSRHWDAIGNSVKCFLFIDVKSGYAEEVAEKLLKFDQIHELQILTDTPDILAVTRTKNMMEHQYLINKIYSTFGSLIMKTKSNVIMDYVQSQKSILDLTEHNFNSIKK